jgi:hypothetical protein
LTAALVIVAGAGPADAHPVPFSYLDLHVGRDAIDGTLVAHIFDVAHDLNVDPPERLLEPAVTRAEAPAVIALLSPRVALAANGQPLVPAWSAVEALPERQSLRLTVRYGLPSPAGAVRVTAHCFPYDPNHQTFLNVYEGTDLTQAILDDRRTDFEYFAGTRQGAAAVMRRFVPAGVRHIVLGPDHLLFLLGLLLLGGTFWQLAVVATSFTVAHAVTLSLAAFNIVAPPGRVIDPATALAIVYVGADNLIVSGPRGGKDVRAWIALAFGLMHGLGFAGALREMDLPRTALVWSLVGVNLGMEIGQLAVVALVLSLLVALRSRSEIAGRQLAFAGSIVVIVAGAVWFVQRVFFPGGIS